MRRKRTSPGLIVSVVVVAIAVVAVGAVLAVRTANPTAEAVATTVPSPQAQTVTRGCAALPAVESQVVAIARTGRTAALLATTGPGTPWYTVTAMEGVGGTGRYQAIADDTRLFIQSYSVADSTGDVSVVSDALVRLSSDCHALGATS